MELKQLFKWSDMPNEFAGEEACLVFSGFDGADGGHYYRWYPNEVKEDNLPGKELNQWLLDNGMIIDKDDKYFYVLIYIDW